MVKIKASIGFFITIIFLSSCKWIENMAGNLPYEQVKKCCFIPADRDTLFFKCKNKDLVKVSVYVAQLPSYRKVYSLDSTLSHVTNIPLAFIYQNVHKDSIANMYIHIVVTSDRGTIPDYWFIPDKKTWQSKDTLFSYIKTRR